MKKYVYLSLSLLILSVGCNQLETDENIAKWKAEILQVEQDFNDMAKEEGIVEAFYHYAANDGVIKRSGKLVKGNIAIREWYKNDVRPNETLTWKPTFVDVSKSGDLAYTYGDFIFTSVDSTGNKKESTGHFHTVWKRQEDGNWKFVWD